MTDDPKTSRCRAGTEAQRCSFRGTREELAAHADEMSHRRCIVPRRKDSSGEPVRCATALAWYEIQSCDNCVRQVRDDLDALAAAYAHIERVIQQSARRGIAWDALTLAADGSLAGLKPFRETVLPEVEIERQALQGESVTHPAYVERRRVKRPGDVTVPPTGREHFDDHWTTDPLSVLAFLEHHERDWRHEFGHGPAVDVATVAGCLGYLRTWHVLAARTHPGFDDYATEVRELRSRLEHVVGLADDPVRAPAECFDCGGQLVRTYQELHGLTDDWTCRGCGRVYDQPSYFLALRSRRDECQGWVPVRLAAEVLRRPVQTVWWWQQQMAVASVCDPDSRQILVDWTEVAARAAQTRTDRRAS